MNYDLKDKIAIVTAGTRGIGRGIVDLLLNQGAKVGVCARNEERLKELKDKHSDRIFIKPADLENSDEVSSFVKEVIEEWGSVDHLFYNASNPVKNTVSKLTLEDWDRSYNGIIRSLIAAGQIVIPKMKKGGGGTITVISSLTASEPISYLATSSVLRAGLAAWIKLMAKEYGSSKIRVNAVLPGYTRTDLLNMAAEIEADKDGISIDDVYKKWSNLISLERVAETEEVANAALFLASPGASYISGTSLLVDGGTVKGI